MIVSNIQRLLVCATCLIVSGFTYAQDERWFRVELMIFSHQSDSAQSNEVWEPTPLLSYPLESRFLIEPSRIARNLEQFDASSEVDAWGLQTLTINPLVVFDPDAPIDSIETITDTIDAEARESVTDPNETGQLHTEPVLPVTPTPFVALKHSELEFRGKAAYMQRTGRYRTLYHETWIQPMADENSALPIILDHSGDDEDWPRLQGSIKFYLARYLHVETNIWLNTTGSYLPGEWRMPAAPLGPKSLTIVYPPEPTPDPNIPELVIEKSFPIGEAASAFEERDIELEPQAPAYPWRHAILLQQKRRMRSTEVHYIDHPLLGMVIKTTPLTDDDLLQRAAAEAAEKLK